MEDTLTDLLWDLCIQHYFNLCDYYSAKQAPQRAASPTVPAVPQDSVPVPPQQADPQEAQLAPITAPQVASEIPQPLIDPSNALLQRNSQHFLGSAGAFSNVPQAPPSFVAPIQAMSNSSVVNPMAPLLTQNSQSIFNTTVTLPETTSRKRSIQQHCSAFTQPKIKRAAPQHLSLESNFSQFTLLAGLSNGNAIEQAITPQPVQPFFAGVNVASTHFSASFGVQQPALPVAFPMGTVAQNLCPLSNHSQMAPLFPATSTEEYLANQILVQQQQQQQNDQTVDLSFSETVASLESRSPMSSSPDSLSVSSVEAEAERNAHTLFNWLVANPYALAALIRNKVHVNNDCLIDATTQTPLPSNLQSGTASRTRASQEVIETYTREYVTPPCEPSSSDKIETATPQTLDSFSSNAHPSLSDCPSLLAPSSVLTSAPAFIPNITSCFVCFWQQALINLLSPPSCLHYPTLNSAHGTEEVDVLNTSETTEDDEESVNRNEEEEETRSQAGEPSAFGEEEVQRVEDDTEVEVEESSSSEGPESSTSQILDQEEEEIVEYEVQLPITSQEGNDERMEEDDENSLYRNEEEDETRSQAGEPSASGEEEEQRVEEDTEVEVEESMEDEEATRNSSTEEAESSTSHGLDQEEEEIAESEAQQPTTSQEKDSERVEEDDEDSLNRYEEEEETRSRVEEPNASGEEEELRLEEDSGVEMEEPMEESSSSEGPESSTSLSMDQEEEEIAESEVQQPTTSIEKASERVEEDDENPLNRYEEEEETRSLVEEPSASGEEKELRLEEDTEVDVEEPMEENSSSEGAESSTSHILDQEEEEIVEYEVQLPITSQEGNDERMEEDDENSLYRNEEEDETRSQAGEPSASGEEEEQRVEEYIYVEVEESSSSEGPESSTSQNMDQEEEEIAEFEVQQPTTSQEKDSERVEEDDENLLNRNEEETKSLVEEPSASEEEEEQRVEEDTEIEVEEPMEENSSIEEAESSTSHSLDQEEEEIAESEVQQPSTSQQKDGERMEEVEDEPCVLDILLEEVADMEIGTSQPSTSQNVEHHDDERELEEVEEHANESLLKEVVDVEPETSQPGTSQNMELENEKRELEEEENNGEEEEVMNVDNELEFPVIPQEMDQMEVEEPRNPLVLEDEVEENEEQPEEELQTASPFAQDETPRTIKLRVLRSEEILVFMNVVTNIRAHSFQSSTREAVRMLVDLTIDSPVEEIVAQLEWAGPFSMLVDEEIKSRGDGTHRLKSGTIRWLGVGNSFDGLSKFLQLWDVELLKEARIVGEGGVFMKSASMTPQWKRLRRLEVSGLKEFEPECFKFFDQLVIQVPLVNMSELKPFLDAFRQKNMTERGGPSFSIHTESGFDLKLAERAYGSEESTYDELFFTLPSTAGKDVRAVFFFQKRHLRGKLVRAAELENRNIRDLVWDF